MLLFAGLLMRRNGISSPWLCVNSLLMVGIILGATILSPFADYRWGGLLGFALLAFLYILNLRDVQGGRALRKLFMTANVLNIAGGVGIIVGYEPVRAFFVDYYSAFYPELVELMTRIGKPVLTFGTHSLAGFFFYLFFFMNWETYKLRGGRPYLAFALGYIALGFSLMSVTGLVLMSIAVFQVLSHASQQRPKMLASLAAIACFCAGLTLYHYRAEIEDITEATKSVTDIMKSPTSGVFGRFSQTGTMFSTVRYLQDRPLSPIGVGFRDDLFVGDCGPVEYYLRGSFFLLAAVYVGLFFFLRENLISKRDAIYLFLVILFFEIGMTSLTYIRTLYLLPVIIVYLNDLRRSSEPVLADGMTI